MNFPVVKLNKRKLSFFLSLLFLSTPVFIIIFYSNHVSPAVSGSDRMPLLIIDPGHGGIDSGAVASDGTKESDINLAISLKLRAIAEFYGHSNILTRDEDCTLSDSEAYSEHRDLEHRSEIINSENKAVCISIHQNFFPTGQPSGSLVIYAPDDESEKLGKLTHDNLLNSLSQNSRRVAEPADDNYYILNNVNCPAILVECGFMSNFSEIERLKSPGYQSSLAAILMASFMQYTHNMKYI